MEVRSSTSTKNGAIHVARLGHAAFALVMIALGILSLIKRDFTPVWAPVPKNIPAREILIYACAIISLGSGVGLFWKRTAATAARVLLIWLLLWMLVFKVRPAFAAPTEIGSWYGAAETAVVVAAAWVLYAWFVTGWERQRLGFATGDNGVRIARVLFGLALIFFGVGHVAYLKQTVVLVPAWLPGHVFWAYFTGGTFISAGLAVLTGVWARLAAALAALQIGLFIGLVWLPIVCVGHVSEFQWGEFVVTCTLTAGAWVVADSYRDVSWFALNRR